MASVSVIIPTYNCARYLPASIDSVLAQSVAPMEIVVVDDGSTDATDTVLGRYRERLTIVRAPHAGYAAARNLGLRHARGEWIAFHDADDVALPDRLAVSQEYLARNPDLEALLLNGERMDAADVPAGERVVSDTLAATVRDRDLTVGDLFDGFPAYLQGALLSRRAVETAGEFDVTLSIYSDMDYAYRLFGRARARFVDRIVFRYRWHGDNVTRDRLAGRSDIARILERIVTQDPAGARAIGRRRLRVRLARHYYRIGRSHLARGELDAAQPVLTRAAALRPLHPAYQLTRLWHAARRRSA
jgi:glycosyltransferase involved in cell wall biosynthesis